MIGGATMSFYIRQNVVKIIRFSMVFNDYGPRVVIIGCATTLSCVFYHSLISNITTFTIHYEKINFSNFPVS